MMTMDRDGLLLWHGRNDGVAGRKKATITISAEVAMRDSSAIERVIDAIFDLLGSCAIELRVRAEPQATSAQPNACLASAARSAA